MSQRDSLLGIFSVIYRWKKWIINICLLALVGSIIATLLLKNYYESSTVFYPVNPRVSNPEMIFGTAGEVMDYFGGDQDLDRILELASGGELVDFMIQRFRLHEHYDIDSTSQKGRFFVREAFRSHYKAEKNKNDAVVITVEDTDPELAATMANEARLFIDRTAQRFIKESQAKILATFDLGIKRKMSELKIITDSLSRLQYQYNIYNPGTQGERLGYSLSIAESEITRSRAKLEILQNNPLVPQDTVEFIKANLRAYERERESLVARTTTGDKLNLQKYNEASPTITVLSDLHFQARKQLSYDLERYNQILSTYNSKISLIHTVETAKVPYIKSRPKRSMLVVISVIGALLFSVIGALLFEAYKDMEQQS